MKVKIINSIDKAIETTMDIVPRIGEQLQLDMVDESVIVSIVNVRHILQSSGHTVAVYVR